jgi:hypothetical protein
MIAASVALPSGPLTTPSVLAMVVLPNPDLAARLRHQNLLRRPPRLLPLHKVLGRPPLKPRGLLHRMCLAPRKVVQLHLPQLRLRLSLPPLPLLLRQYHLVIRAHRAHLKYSPVALLHRPGLPPRHLDHPQRPLQSLRVAPDCHLHRVVLPLRPRLLPTPRALPRLARRILQHRAVPLHPAQPQPRLTRFFPFLRRGHRAFGLPHKVVLAVRHHLLDSLAHREAGLHQTLHLPRPRVHGPRPQVLHGLPAALGRLQEHLKPAPVGKALPASPRPKAARAAHLGRQHGRHLVAPVEHLRHRLLLRKLSQVVKSLVRLLRLLQLDPLKPVLQPDHLKLVLPLHLRRQALLLRAARRRPVLHLLPGVLLLPQTRARNPQLSR